MGLDHGIFKKEKADDEDAIWVFRKQFDIHNWFKENLPKVENLESHEIPKEVYLRFIEYLKEEEYDYWRDLIKKLEQHKNQVNYYWSWW